MSSIRLIIFDLDGTLIDSSRDLGTSTNATRAQFSLPPLAQHIINSYVGNGAAVLVQRAIGADVPEERQAEALDFFLKYYRAHSLEHTKLYPGVDELVEQLAGDGYRLGVLTNKPEKISFDILGALGIGQRFFRIYGGNTFAQKKPHPVGILKMAEEASAAVKETLMVGDSAVDVETARNARAACCGVTWGFQPETFERVPPDYVIDNPGELLAVARLSLA